MNRFPLPFLFQRVNKVFSPDCPLPAAPSLWRSLFLYASRLVAFVGSSVKCVDWRIKAYALAGRGCPKSDDLTKEDKLKDKMQERQIDTMSVHQHFFPSSTDNLFSYHRRL